MESIQDYKTRKVESVTGLGGSSVTHINLVSSVALSSIALYYALRTRFPSSPTTGLVASWTILVFPLLLSMTLFATRPTTLFFVFAIPAGAISVLIPKKERGAPPLSPISPPPATHTQFERAAPTKSMPSIPQLNCVTTYRAHMLLMTTFAILAVDFPVFPRMLAKCETFGVSLMDLGVGSFVFVQGLVSAIPLVKNPSHLTSPLIPKVLTIIRKMVPIIALGLVRVVLVKGTEYPEHETEYGAHWNFFITLALVPVMQVILHPLMVHYSVTFIGIAVAILHQVALSKFGLEEYVFTAPRVSIISANKEGIVSLTGYFAIHLLGLTTGMLILPPSPSYFRRIQKRLLKQKRNPLKKLTAARQDDKTATELCAYAVVWWILFGLTRVLKLDGGNGASRRLVNVSYIFWVSAYNTSFVLGYMVLDILFFPTTRPSKPKYSKDKLTEYTEVSSVDVSSEETPPKMFSAVNKNGLALFLISNLATGIVNLSIRTLDTSDTRAMFILGGYGFGVCLVAWVFRNRKLWQL
ncbi:GWT1-domain-containing protein [Marasmius fiardii PR-910]|nr:GWT1-domain-containing protein [Marasmius fiardii PR-910]